MASISTNEDPSEEQLKRLVNMRNIAQKNFTIKYYQMIEFGRKKCLYSDM